MSKNAKITLYILSILLFIIGFVPTLSKYQIIIYGLSVLLCGCDLLIEGITNIFKLKFEEDTLMTIAVISAFILGEYPESVAVILLYKLGELLEEMASNSSNNAIKEISKIKAEKANLYIEKEIKVVDVKELKVGDKILIKPGEKVPVDCRVIQGKSTIDTSSITGESKPKTVAEKQEVLSGSININSAIQCEVIRNFENSTASQIIDLVSEAINNKGKTEKFITKFSKIYTPIVIALAVLIAIIPPIIFKTDFTEWIRRGLVFLVASCPCSIVISVPLAFFACVGNISKKGMLIKGTKHIENLSKTTAICFDKTGTLTSGEMQVSEIQNLNGYSKDEILTYIYNIEKLSNHPISKAITDYIKNREEKEVGDFKEIPGMGLQGKIDQKEIIMGNKKILKQKEIDITNIEEGVIYIGIDKKLAGYIRIEEKIREESKDIVREFLNINIKRIVMLTGDSKKSANRVAERIDINEVYSELLPKDKLEQLRKIKEESKTVMFVGDGINDSPVLTASDFGIAMGKGTEIASCSADGILLSNDISTIPGIIKIARKSMKTVKANIVFSILIKIVVLILGILGLAPIWLAVLSDTGVTAITVINSMRILKA